MRTKQQSFLPKLSLEHGGQSRKGMRKIMRPFDPKQPLHLVLKSSQATGAQSMLQSRYKTPIEELTRKIAKRRGVQLLMFVNVGNHLHALVLCRRRPAFRTFLRELAGAIACLMTGAHKGAPGMFWDQPVYTRIVSWGREVRNLEQYFIKNLFEATGLLTRRARAAGLTVIPITGGMATIPKPA
jgi:REP element-mobilizing transposase RayT